MYLSFVCVGLFIIFYLYIYFVSVIACVCIRVCVGERGGETGSLSCSLQMHMPHSHFSSSSTAFKLLHERIIKKVYRISVSLHLYLYSCIHTHKTPSYNTK